MPRISFFKRDMLVPGTYDELHRITMLRAAGLSYETIGILVDRSQSTVHRMMNPASYAAHLKYNAAWKRAKRRKGV